MGPRRCYKKELKSEKPDPNANGYPNTQAYLSLSTSLLVLLSKVYPNSPFQVPGCYGYSLRSLIINFVTI